MNGLDFARALTAGGFSRVLVHAAPSRLRVHVTSGDGATVASGEPDRAGEDSPITPLELAGARLRRAAPWPDDGYLGLPVLRPGGEVGVLTAWQPRRDRSWPPGS